MILTPYIYIIPLSVYRLIAVHFRTLAIIGVVAACGLSVPAYTYPRCMMHLPCMHPPAPCNSCLLQLSDHEKGNTTRTPVTLLTYLLITNYSLATRLDMMPRIYLHTAPLRSTLGS